MQVEVSKLQSEVLTEKVFSLVKSMFGAILRSIRGNIFVICQSFLISNKSFGGHRIICIQNLYTRVVGSKFYFSADFTKAIQHICSGKLQVLLLHFLLNLFLKFFENFPNFHPIGGGTNLGKGIYTRSEKVIGLHKRRKD